jgi:hypothetical protein
MTVRRAAIALAVAGAVVLALVLAARSGTPAHRSPAVIDIAEGRELARSACREFTRFERLVQTNARARDVSASMAGVVALSREAVDRDPIWAQLWSGTRLVQVSLAQDDPSGARRGVDTVRDACSAVIEAG